MRACPTYSAATENAEPTAAGRQHASAFSARPNVGVFCGSSNPPVVSVLRLSGQLFCASPRSMSEIKDIDPEFAAMGGLLPSVLSELAHYKDNHRLLIVVTCTFAELMVTTIIEAECKRGKAINDSSRDFPFSVRLTLLYELDLISKAEYEAFNWLRKRRNDAAHQPGFAFDHSHMPSWADENHKTPDKLFSLCVTLISVFWNARVELFREKLPVKE